MNICPCCSETLLRHVRHNKVYWFCPHCHQEMPNFSLQSAAQQLLAAKPLQAKPLEDRLFSHLAPLTQ
ncbi:MAG: hypothetical protein AAFX78_05475 [Cyanobacteria bacterium J06638_20]